MYTIESQGFPLTLHRIINPLANPATLNKYPVVYGHGVLFDSQSMLTRSENSRPRRPVLGQPTIKYANNNDLTDDHSLPFMLSNNNFDVWLYDSRGTNELNRDQVKRDFAREYRFWDYSLDEQGLVDLPLFIDFVLSKTGAKKVAYVGYSESTFFLFALLTSKPEYADKIVAAATMAPVAYVGHIRGLTLPLLLPIALLTPEFVHSSFVPQPAIDALDNILKYLCKQQGLNNLVCGTLIDGVGGFGKSEHGREFYENFYKSTSLKSIKHFVQLLLGQRFGMYDHGPLENMRRYGQVNAPNYDLKKLRSDRIILVRGLADFLSTPEDQERLKSEMGVKPYADIVIPKYNHFDFIDGRNLIELCNGPIVTKFYELMYREGPNILKDPAELTGSRLGDLTQSMHPSLQPKSRPMSDQSNYEGDVMANTMGFFNNLMSPQSLFDRIMPRSQVGIKLPMRL